MRSKLYKFVRDYISFSAVESSGSVVLFGIMAIVLMAPLVVNWLHDPAPYDNAHDRQILDSLVALMESGEEEESLESIPLTKVKADPNTASSEELAAVGIPKYLAERIVKYRAAGGSFSKPEDLTRIYGFSQALFDQIEPNLDLPSESREVEKDIKDPVAVLKKFDPNTASVSELENLGIPTWLAERIEKYRSKGGSFKDKASLSKIYGFPEELYLELEDYIEISGTPTNSKEAKNEVADLAIVPFDLNTADSIQLRSVRGIGGYFASRIVRLRNDLGGIVSPDQLMEIFRMDSATVDKLMSQVFISENFIPVKINLNLADEETLAHHPYIGWKYAKLIVAYRQQHPLRNLDDLNKIKPVTEPDVKRMAPYISF